MKLIAKTKAVLMQNKAETMVEVIVAFAVLSIIMVLFAQGMRYAATAENHAVENTKNSDRAMLRLQQVISKNYDVTNEPEDQKDTIEDNPINADPDKIALDGKEGVLKLTKYEVELKNAGDSNKYLYYVFDAN